MSLSKIEEPFKISLVYIYVQLYIYIIIGIWVKLN